jgi:hypothetical protein
MSTANFRYSKFCFHVFTLIFLGYKISPFLKGLIGNLMGEISLRGGLELKLFLGEFCLLLSGILPEHG